MQQETPSRAVSPQYDLKERRKGVRSPEPSSSSKLLVGSRTGKRGGLLKGDPNSPPVIVENERKGPHGFDIARYIKLGPGVSVQTADGHVRSEKLAQDKIHMRLDEYRAMAE